jgi:hypothetical protein
MTHVARLVHDSARHRSPAGAVGKPGPGVAEAHAGALFNGLQSPGTCAGIVADPSVGGVFV